MSRKVLVYNFKSFVGCGILLAPVFLKYTPILYYNATDSLPKGFYVVIDHKPPKRGDIVLVKLPNHIAVIAQERGYLPRHVPLLKKIGALEGDLVCRFGLDVTINQSRRFKALRNDAKGRHMPVWQGCNKLKRGELFLLSPYAKSFDSRYFGSIQSTDLLGGVQLVVRFFP